MNYILYDDISREHLFPLTFTKPVSELRIGILKISEKWGMLLNSKYSFLTVDYLSEKYPVQIENDNILINGRFLPSKKLVDKIRSLNSNEGISYDDEIVALRCNNDFVLKSDLTDVSDFSIEDYKGSLNKINYPNDIFELNGEAIESDFQLVTYNRTSAKISSSMQIIAPHNVFVEEGAKMEFATINASNGPVYIGRDSEIMEGALIRGPFALCESSVIKLGCKIYGPTTIGPFSKAGGEINNVVIQGYSNKGHDGFLGNSVIGEWCNIGADTNNSNLKNNYAEVKLWDYVDERFRGTGSQFCGLIMGDHSKCGINTMFNTGTVVGIFANIFGSGFPRNFIPSFAWGGARGFKIYNKTAAFYVAKLVMERRGIVFNDIEKRILTAVFNMTKKYRNFE